MQVILQTSRITSEGHAQKFGDVIDVPKDEAKRMIAAGQAREAGELIETAMSESVGRGQPQTRSTRRGVQ